MSVSSQFKSFCSSLNVSQITRSHISDRYERITQRLNYDFWNIDSNKCHSLYVGSYGRGTATKGFSDLDVIFILPYHLYVKYDNYTFNGQSSLLQAVKNSLKKTYSNTDVGGDGQVVVIQFSDDMRFEVVPAFEKKDNSFTYPDSNNGGKWKVTNPKPEIQTLKNDNQLTNGNLINLCKMARSWKKEWNVPMGGLLIDTLAHKFLMNWEYKNESYIYYDWMSRDFFKYLSNQNSDQQYWFAVGSNQYIHRKGNFEGKAKKCYQLALDAIEYESKDMNYSATHKWREIYGTAYPSP